MSSEVRVGDALVLLREMPAESVQCVVTSPPYFALRDYGVAGQLGLEATPGEYVAKLVAVFAELRRVLRQDGTVWLNLGDSYAGSWSNQAQQNSRSRIAGYQRAAQPEVVSHAGSIPAGASYKAKDLLGIPWMVAFALRADGWWLRSEIVWDKPNPLPESVRDRPTQSHEKLFLLTKAETYFYDQDAIREPYAEGSVERIEQGFKDRYAAVTDVHGHRGQYGGESGEQVHPAGRNKRNVWSIATYPFPEAHFATFPPKLAEPCVLAGSAPRCCGVCGAPWRRLTEREDQGYDGSRYGERAVHATGGAVDGGTARSTLGSSNGKMVGRSVTVGWERSCEHAEDPGDGRSVVLDPFAGSGTVGVVCRWHGRDFVGLELSPDSAELARRRIETDGALGRAAYRPAKPPAEQLGLEFA